MNGIPTELTPELIVALAAPDDPQLSPDGGRVAWVAANYGQEGDHAERSIWVAPTDGGALGRRFAGGNGQDEHPRWSPDGSHLAFLSDRDKRGTLALYVISAGGGEARPLVQRKRGIAGFAWSPDGGCIAFIAPDEPTDDDERRERERDDADVRGARWQYARLWLADATTGAVTPLPTGDTHVTECAWSPDGAAVAYLAQPTPDLDDRLHTTVYTIAPDGGEPRHVCGTAGGASQLAWSTGEHGGETLVWVGPHEPEPQCASTAWAVAASGGEPAVIGTQRDEDACTSGIRAIAGEPFAVTARAHGLTTTLVQTNAPDNAPYAPLALLAHPTGDLGAFAVAAPQNGEPVVAVVRSDGGSPPELWAGAPGRLHRVSDHHAALAGVRWGKQEPFYWDAPDGMKMDGVLIRPPDARNDDGPLPTVVLVHGGPYGRWGNGFNLRPLNWAQWLATAGYAVLLPNCRGGMGHGNAFAKAARADVGGADYADIMAGVDAAVERGIADAERLGIGGWSQGGFMTAWAITQTNRFKAGVMGAGVSDWGMMTLTSDLPTFEKVLGGDSPWDGPGPHRHDALSPISFAANVRTPLLILHGKEDARVPWSQAVGYERALRGRVPVELVGYPREPHGIRERAHQRDILRRVRAWFDRHLKGD